MEGLHFIEKKYYDKSENIEVPIGSINYLGSRENLESFRFCSVSSKEGVLSYSPRVYFGKRYTVGDFERIHGKTSRTIALRKKGCQFLCLTNDFRFVPMEEGSFMIDEYEDSLRISMSDEDKKRIGKDILLGQVASGLRELEYENGSGLDLKDLSDYQKGVLAGKYVGYRDALALVRELREEALDKSTSLSK